MLTSAHIKKKALELGAAVCGIGSLSLFEGEDLQRDPKMILPAAKCIVGFGFAVPRGLYRAMDQKRQFYTYMTEGVKYLDDEFSEIFLFKIGRIIEDAGYDACLQKSVPNLRAKGDKTTNPEVLDTFELISDPVEPGKPAPDVMIDFAKAAKACGIGEQGMSGSILSKEYGPFIRYSFIITDAPLETDAPLTEPICDRCGKCAAACPGNAICEDGRDTWQCAVTYRGAFRDNPFMTDDFLRGDPERDDILDGKKRFDSKSARALYPKERFLPNSHNGYVPCICGKRCDVACWRHLKETGKL